MHTLNEECVHVQNTGFSIDMIKQCTDHPRVIPNIRVGATTDATTESAEIIGGMGDMKDLVQGGHGRTSDEECSLQSP